MNSFLFWHYLNARSYSKIPHAVYSVANDLSDPIAAEIQADFNEVTADPDCVWFFYLI